VEPEDPTDCRSRDAAALHRLIFWLGDEICLSSGGSVVERAGERVAASIRSLLGGETFPPSAAHTRTSIMVPTVSELGARLVPSEGISADGAP
jgi:hypothetical protein